MDFMRDLANKVKEEQNAVLQYQELAAYAPNDIARRLILKISKEEGRHADSLAWILEVCGETAPPTQQISNPRGSRPKSRVGPKKYK